jgi:hypothetical protein
LGQMRENAAYPPRTARHQSVARHEGLPKQNLQNIQIGIRKNSRDGSTERSGERQSKSPVTLHPKAGLLSYEKASAFRESNRIGQRARKVTDRSDQNIPLLRSNFRR